MRLKIALWGIKLYRREDQVDEAIITFVRTIYISVVGTMRGAKQNDMLPDNMPIISNWI